MARIRQKTIQYPGLDNVYTFADEAGLFDAERPWVVGDYCIYAGDLYRCTTDHTGSWNSEHFKAVKTGDELKALNKALNVLTEAVSTESITFTEEKYIKNNVAVGETVSLTPIDYTGYRCTVVECSEGDEFILQNVRGGSTPRLYSFLDSSNVALEVAIASRYIRDPYLITAPAGSAKVVFNDHEENYPGTIYAVPNLNGAINPWGGKKIVWYGTSISAGGYIGRNNSNAIPQKIGSVLGANVINEAIGSSCVHCKQSSMYNASTNPYAFFSHKFEMASRCLSNSTTEMQWIIDHFTFFSDAPASLSDELKAQILANGYQAKIDPYLTASTFPDLFVFEHGFNDVINGDMKATQDLDYVNDEGVHLYSYRSAMDFLITRILNYDYHAKIVIIGTYNAYGPSGTKSGDVWRMQEEVAQKYNIPLLNLWDLIGWSDQATVTVGGQTKTLAQAWLTDGIHPHSDASGKATQKYVDVVSKWLMNLKL